MIVLDTSIFIDLLFEYNSERTRSNYISGEKYLVE